MKITSAIAIYFVIWWTVLFMVLPFGVRNASESGETVEEGHDAGAPVAHGLKWKALVTTAVASVVFIGVYFILASGVLETMDLPFLSNTFHL